MVIFRWRMTRLSKNVRKNGFRIKGSKHHYFGLKTFWKMSPIFSASSRECGRIREKGTVLRSTLNWKSDVAAIDQFLSIARVSRKVFIFSRPLRGIEHVSKDSIAKSRSCSILIFCRLGVCEPALAGYRIELILAQHELNHVSGTNGI